MSSDFTISRLRALIAMAGYKHYTVFARKYGIHRNTIRNHFRGGVISPLAAARYEQIENEITTKGAKR